MFQRLLDFEGNQYLSCFCTWLNLMCEQPTILVLRGFRIGASVQYLVQFFMLSDYIAV